MIRNDFYTGGFPITSRSPIVLISNESIKTVYNRYDLKLELDLIKKNSSDIKCFGVWPGNKITDIFVLNPDYYGYLCPPENHKDIDNSKEIKVTIDDKTGFKEVYYIWEGVKVISKDSDLFKYIKEIGLRYTVQYESMD